MALVVFCWGNPSRGDDGVGPWLAERIRQRTNPALQLVEDFQLQVEHLLDCRQAELMLFLDAHCASHGDFLFQEVAVDPAVAHTSHALSPGELLGYYARTFAGELPAPAFQLTVPGSDFTLGHALSPRTRECCQRASIFIESLLATPDPYRWRNMARERRH